MHPLREKQHLFGAYLDLINTIVLDLNLYMATVKEVFATGEAL